ncbi:MAG: family 78 glycoside hydrolase catalytic domain [Proteiniphilum sp.]|jgi:alpha-L-rhamnosidase|nr:family 78 glycoside hydrolase catalytic domain [Proteiniphilum sp.]NCB24085.1 alpha-rhamnosidase [Bacteroidia bacterium]MDD2937003.1 family 78 glycoside hydrolase catalytic domain [Proteiniphilum sp.]MDD3075463.1 family 78 glycoside hydrolase catalytic domain [Proteiniphilum sp.]MDD3778540.1 family 78 glycoside hydrolase catalytic domain [Proteiniphilum sp.]
MKNIYLLIGFLFVVMMAGCGNAQTEVTSLRVEMQENPNGVAITHPRFSWQIRSALSDVVQQSYQIQVAGSENDLKKEQNLLWNSGIIESDLSVLIPYAGEELQSRKSFFWRVKVTTNKGETAWSETGYWSMAILDNAEWQAQWIGEDSLSNQDETMKGNTRLAARYLRKPFSADKQVKRAMLYISGLGNYKAYLNGEKVSDDVFAPTVSWYPERVYYNVYDVTSLAKKGDNLLAVKLGNGRYFGMRESVTQVFGLPRLLAQLELEYGDGTTELILSDASWKITSKGPIIANNEFDGEEYDARLEMDNWNKVKFDDSQWQPVDLMTEPGGLLTAQPNPNIRVMEEIKPVGITELADGRYILDMGQNMVGWLHTANLKGKKDQPVSFRFAELLNPDSTLYLANLRGAKVTDRYIPSADGTFDWEPSFVYHGFRFVEISGLTEKPELQYFTGKVIYDQMETTGQFETNDTIINQTFKNAYWGIRGNYRGMPTDCPQRDERQGWLGDRATGCFGEAFVFNNAHLYAKWLQDIEDSQSPEGSISVVSPRYWTIYNDDVTWPAAWFYGAKMLWHQYGNTTPIFRHYAAMKHYLERIQQVSMQDYILTKDTYGDWCMPPESQELIHSQDPSRKTAGAVLSTTMYYSLLNLMVEFAELTGNQDDIAGYQDLAGKIKDAYNRTYFNADSARYDNNTVTANILSLQLGLVPEGYEKALFENIVQKTEVDFSGHVSTGVLGIQQLMRGLTQHGNVDLAYKIATNTTYPSWGYMIEKGATTIWELWNGDTADPAMNSANHVMLLGDLLIWYYEDLAGIKNHPGSVAYKKLLMEPRFPEGLSHVKASYNSVYGEIKSEWSKKNDTFDWEISIPANTSAIVRLPQEMHITTPEGEGVRSVTQADTRTEIELGSGTYRLLGKL